MRSLATVRKLAFVITKRKQVKNIIQICCILISLLTAAEGFAGSYKAQGEIYYETGQTQAKWSRTVNSKVVSGVPVKLKTGEQVVSMLFTIEPPPSKKYTVTVSLMTDPKYSDDISVTLFTRTYEATLVGGPNGPFEFEEIQGDTKFGGALALSLRQ